MHQAGVKYVQANACPCRSANRPYTSGCPSDKCRNQGPTWVPNVTRITTNVSETIKESQEADPTICQAINPDVFHKDIPAFSPSLSPRGDEWPALLACNHTDHAAPSLTKTAAPDPAAPAAVGSGKRNSNSAQSMGSKSVSSSTPANQDSDITLVASIGEIYGDSDYVELTKNHPRSRPALRTSRDK